jgi:phosphoribosylanthranilate isomerase
MNPPVEVKICGLTRETDILAAARLGANYFGVNCYEGSPRYCNPAVSAAILAAIPGGKSVAVDVAPSNETLAGYREAGFQYSQVHFDLDTPVATLAGWSDVAGRDRLWLAPQLPPDEAFPENILEFAETVLVDAYSAKLYGGTGETGNWQEFNALHDIYPGTRWVLAGGLSPDNIEFALQASGACIVDVASGIEDRPGIKNHDAMEAFFANLKR